MPRSPSIVPEDTNRDVYLVLDDFGRLGRAWRETDETGTSRATLVTLHGGRQYFAPHTNDLDALVGLELPTNGGPS
jgi:hypothetical protein